MPYDIIPYKYGFRVCKEDNKKECFSNKPLTKKQAEKQKTAIILSELRKKGKLEGGKNNIKFGQRRSCKALSSLGIFGCY
jgi:hypothetical protein